MYTPTFAPDVSNIRIGEKYSAILDPELRAIASQPDELNNDNDLNSEIEKYKKSQFLYEECMFIFYTIFKAKFHTRPLTVTFYEGKIQM